MVWNKADRAWPACDEAATLQISAHLLSRQVLPHPLTSDGTGSENTPRQQLMARRWVSGRDRALPTGLGCRRVYTGRTHSPLCSPGSAWVLPPGPCQQLRKTPRERKQPQDVAKRGSLHTVKSYQQEHIWLRPQHPTPWVARVRHAWTHAA